jgi:hypothetical protein
MALVPTQLLYSYSYALITPYAISQSPPNFPGSVTINGTPLLIPTLRLYNHQLPYKKWAIITSQPP